MNDKPRIGYFKEDGSPALTHYEDHYTELLDGEWRLNCGNDEDGEATGNPILVTCPNCLEILNPQR